MNAPDTAPTSLDDRFWAKVDKNGPVVRPEIGPCWPWMAGRHERGYGIFSDQRLSRRAHRMVLEEKLGRRLAEGENALHACDNPPCCNPAHLFPGTHQDNKDDSVIKGRHARGEGSGNAKLTAEQAKEIRERARDGESPTSLGREFGVRKFVVQQIRDGNAWRQA